MNTALLSTLNNEQTIQVKQSTKSSLLSDIVTLATLFVANASIILLITLSWVS